MSMDRPVPFKLLKLSKIRPWTYFDGRLIEELLVWVSTTVCCFEVREKSLIRAVPLVVVYHM